MSQQPIPAQQRRSGASFWVEEDYTSSSSGSSDGQGGSHPLTQPPAPPPQALGTGQQNASAHTAHRGGALGAQRGGHVAQRGAAPAHPAPPPAMNPQWHAHQQQPPPYGRSQNPARGGGPRPAFVPGRGFLPPGGHAPSISHHAAPWPHQVGGMDNPSIQSAGSGSPGSYPDVINPARALSGTANFSGLSDRSSSGGSTNWGQARPAPGGTTRRCTICTGVYYVANEADHMRDVHGISA